METIVIGEDRLKIMLSSEDLAKYRVEGKDLDVESERVRKALRAILDDVGLVTGFDTSPGRVYVQIYESRAGGCEMFVTRLPQELVEDEASLSILLFEKRDHMRMFCRRLLAAGFDGKSDAYSLGERWCLRFDGTLPLCACDFGRVMTAELLPYITEYGCKTISDCAVHRLGAEAEGVGI